MLSRLSGSRASLSIFASESAGGEAWPPTARAYEIADCRLYSDRPIAHLAPFAARRQESDRLVARPVPPESAGLPTRFDGRVWLGGHERRLICRADDTYCLLAAEGMTEVAVALDLGTITCLGRRVFSSTIAGEGDAMDLVIGPALILALATHGVFCLHASAIAADDHCRVFLGSSGVGKSTLVAATPAGVQRLADDILPMRAGRPPRALPAFPQLKLAVAEQPVALGPLAVDSISLLETELPADGDVERLALSTSDATVALARHTVAARLFGPSLLDRHIDFCAQVAETVEVVCVRFRRDLALLPRLRRALF